MVTVLDYQKKLKLSLNQWFKLAKNQFLSHIVGIYKYFGYNKFILALGYKSNFIKSYFYKKNFKDEINMIYTGKDTKTGGRLLKLKKYLLNEKTFMLTYGDGSQV